MHSKSISNIVWAIDTLEQKQFQQGAEFLIGAMTRKTSAKVYPAHILSFPYVSGHESTDYDQAYLALAEKRLKQLPYEADNKLIQEGKVFLDHKGSVRNSVSLLVNYAKQISADAIVASTHSHSLIGRMLMGSFAETLLLQSDVPVITVNPATRIRESISKILFPTNFNTEFRSGFHKTLQICKDLGVESLSVFFQEPLVPLLGADQEYFQVLQQEDKIRKREANLWREWARDQGIQLEVHMNTVPGNVVDEIENYATKNNFDLIVMVSETKNSDGPQVGSTCRKIVRTAQCPVWTMKTKN